MLAFMFLLLSLLINILFFLFFTVIAFTATVAFPVTATIDTYHPSAYFSTVTSGIGDDCVVVTVVVATFCFLIGL